MAEAKGYWERFWRQRLSRRRVITGAAMGGAGLADAAVIGCGEEEEPTATPAPGAATPAPGTPAATATPAVAQPQRGGKHVHAATGDMTGWDPVKDTNINSYTRHQLVYAGLVRWRVGSDVEPADIIVDPDMAESHEQPEPTLLTFKMRPNLSFHDGSPVTSEDVVSTLERLLRTDIPGHDRQFFYDSFKSAQFVDGQTLNVTLSWPSPTYIYGLSLLPTGSILKQSIGEADGDWSAHDPAGTGAFKLVSAERGVRYMFERYDQYHLEGKPYFDEVESLPVKDAAARLAYLTSGQTHYDDNLNWTEWMNLEGNSNVVTESYPAGSNMQLMVNQKFPENRDQRLRQALSLAIDREEFRQLFTQGDGEINSVLPALVKQWRRGDPMDLPNMKLDRTQAKQLLSAAGYDSSNPLTMKFFPSAQRRVQGIWAEIIQGQLAQIGVDVKIEPVEHATQVRRKLEGIDPFIIWTRLPDFEVDSYIYSFYAKNGPRNITEIDDAELHDLAIRQRQIVDPEERRKVIQEFELKASEKMYNIPTVSNVRYSAWSAKLANFRSHASLLAHFRVDSVWLKA